jgi:hypothetical protein
MKLLVCGGRDYFGDVEKALDTCLSMNQIDILIHGGARGADSLAAAWAESRGIHCARVNALWNSYGKGAGFKRNSAMLLLQPDGCVAFPGGTGTKMMIDLCRQNNIQVWEPYAAS